MNSWDKKLTTGRFTILADFNNQAVLDNETGLVWERQPGNQPLAWANARLSCARKVVGGRGGWRLPALFELASLIDPTATVGPPLPAGHPFLQVKPSGYWSSTQFADEPGFVLIVDFSLPSTPGEIPVNDANATGMKYAWAVRGGSGLSIY